MYLNRNVKRFCLSNIRKEVKVAVQRVLKQIGNDFPKDESRWLSHYVYREFKIHTDSDGSIKGGLLRLIFSLVDFTFIRSLIADCYGKEGGDCYDPVTLFLLEVIKIWNGYQYYSNFAEDLNDKNKGAQYRYYTGVDIDNIPTEATFHNFRDRVGEEKLQEVINFIVKIFSIVGIITGRILCTDGTLIDTFARYRGCTYMEKCCTCLSCPSNVVNDINSAVGNTVEEMERKDKVSMIAAVKMQCPRDEIIKKLIELVKKKDPEAKLEDIGAFNIIKLHLVKGSVPELEEHRRYLKEVFEGNVIIPEGYSVELISNSISRSESGEYQFNCPRASKDITARIGYRRRKDDPNKLEKIFGYKAIIITSVEVKFNLEIPIAVMTGPGNISEAESFIKIHRELKRHVSFKTEYHILDSGYDYEYVYRYIRDSESKPIIDYNKRREKLDKESLRKRGYDENGRPYAPCGRVCKPGGYDYERKALQNTCGKQCLQCKNTDELPECEYRKNKQGYTKRMSTEELPRLILEVPRGSKRYKKIKAIRSSSERMNSYGKEWTGMSSLRLWGIKAYAVRVAFCCIVMMLKKVMEFILRATIEHRNPALADKLYSSKPKRKLKNCA
ncbi:MAG: transposase [Clostridiaceae bacterium]|nr:transposase [Clostridiaceae bacterium]